MPYALRRAMALNNIKGNNFFMPHRIEKFNRDYFPIRSLTTAYFETCIIHFSHNSSS